MPLDTTRNSTPDTDVPPSGASAYAEALAQVMALAPRCRGERMVCDSLDAEAVRPMLPPGARWAANLGAAVLAAIAQAALAPALAWQALLVAACVGIAMSVAGDRIGATARGLVARDDWPARRALGGLAALDTVVAAVLVMAAPWVAGIPMVVAAPLLLAAAGVGFASRAGDAETEARIAARVAAQGRRETAEHAARRAIAALHAAHAADLARIAAEMGEAAPAT